MAVGSRSIKYAEGNILKAYCIRTHWIQLSRHLSSNFPFDSVRLFNVLNECAFTGVWNLSLIYVISASLCYKAFNVIDSFCQVTQCNTFVFCLSCANHSKDHQLMVVDV
jgi:hypothetical protein